MLGRNIPLADQVKMLHQALSFIVVVFAYETHVVALVYRMTLASAILTHQSFSTSAIVVSLLPTVRTHCLRLSTIVVSLLIESLIVDDRAFWPLSATRSCSHVHISSIRFSIRSAGVNFESTALAFHVHRSYRSSLFRWHLVRLWRNKLSKKFRPQRGVSLSNFYIFALFA